jgi:stearoyl-CoA desaturase (Delta-9 desaturase)
MRLAGLRGSSPTTREPSKLTPTYPSAVPAPAAPSLRRPGRFDRWANVLVMTVPFFALGSAAIEGPVISWVSDHRKHHAFSDQPGDPHSPHVDHGHGVRGVFQGLIHAHLGWLFIHSERGSHERYAPDLMADPVTVFIDRTFAVWTIAGLAAAFALGALIGGSLRAGLTGLLWGGAIRMLVVHHVTYSINSLCHYFGRTPFATGDQSRNLAWLALPTFGEAWHNNHHAFPTSAEHGFGWREPDISGLVIRLMRVLGLAWDVVSVSPERRLKKRDAAASAQSG